MRTQIRPKITPAPVRKSVFVDASLPNPQAAGWCSANRS